MASKTYDEIYDIVRMIPKGKVATYGQIANLHGRSGARQVGYALNNLRNRDDIDDVPWQRVINAKGEISMHGGGQGSFIQQILLEEEGVVFDLKHRVDLSIYRWEPEIEVRGDGN